MPQRVAGLNRRGSPAAGCSGETRRPLFQKRPHGFLEISRLLTQALRAGLEIDDRLDVVDRQRGIQGALGLTQSRG